MVLLISRLRTGFKFKTQILLQEQSLSDIVKKKLKKKHLVM